jgi:hypothetical protein
MQWARPPFRINGNPAISEFQKFCLTAGPNQHYSNPVPPPLEGRFAIVTDVGGGMRWTQVAPKTRAQLADGEVVWS